MSEIHADIEATRAFVPAIEDMRQEHREVAGLVEKLRELCGDDEQAFLDSLEGETDLIEAARRVVRWMLEQEAQAVAVAGLADTYAARSKVFTGRANQARSALVRLMDEIGQKSLPLPEATLTAKATPPKVVGEPDVDQLSVEFVKVERKPDLAAIKAALQAGREVPGCSLSNGGRTLQVRKG